jgi:rare lipoprotein A
MNIVKKYFLYFLLGPIIVIYAFQEVYKQKGLASYYSNKFEGRRTSSGAIFRQDSLTCAHKSLKFGTLLKVTNLRNDSTIVVKVNDRLSQKSRHIIDLTLSAAQKLNFVRQGIVQVEIEKIN